MLTKARITRLRALREKKHREADGLYVVENPKVVAELLAAGVTFAELYATAAWKSPPHALTSEITADEIARISHFPTPSEVFAVGRIERAPLPAGALAHGLTLALDGIQDPGNVGTLLRVSDWFAFDRVLLSPDCADLFSQKVINASMGSFARVKTFTVDLPETLAQANTPVLGCDLGGDDVHALPALRDAVVVIGSEGQGLSDAVRKCVTHYVTIPKYGGAESLNAGVAAAIVCDNLRRALGR
ncbi:MAG TPA: RNA methyltransferase [Rariglobus sp.]|jgi:TrmH family RNA methyltransferase|nr:RNA methyltransferase [Rariglobus sp.]